MVGTENGVRVDGLIRSDVLSAQNSIPFSYDVTNERSTPIGVADIVPYSTYDAEARMVTVSLGSEVPGENLLPRLVSIAPGEKKTFTGVVRLHVLPDATGDPRGRAIRHTLQLKLNFLADLQPFAQLVNIQQKAVQDPKLADQLFPLWLERNEVVFTNSVPMRWRPPQAEPEGTASRRR